MILLVAGPCWGFDINATDCNDGDATTWCIQNDDTTITDADCGGTCSGGDTIYLEGGTRTGSDDHIIITSIDGGSSYIKITNDPTAGTGTRVAISKNDTAAAITITDSKYVNLTGDGLSGWAWTDECETSGCYGIFIEQASSGSAGATMVRVNGESDHIKIGYIEIDSINTTYTTIGLQVQDASLTAAWTFDTFEIHHNFIHDTGVNALYLGHNQPISNDDPYTANFLVHHNILKDIGTYGMGLKGTNGGNSAIYNNWIKTTGVRCDGVTTCTEYGDGYSNGIKVLWTYGTNYVEVYDNWIEKTGGTGIRLGEASHLVHDNILLGNGTGTDDPATWGHAIVVHENDYINNRPDRTVQIYDNIIVEPTAYGVYADGANFKADMNRNIIAEAGTGEYSGAGFTEGTGNDANVVTDDTASICFTTWSDDSDYSNDDFTLCCDYDYTSIAANACGATTTPVSGVKFNGAEYN